MACGFGLWHVWRGTAWWGEMVVVVGTTLAEGCVVWWSELGCGVVWLDLACGWTLHVV